MKIEKDEAMKRFKEKWNRSRSTAKITVKTGACFPNTNYRIQSTNSTNMSGIDEDAVPQVKSGVCRLLIIGDSLVSGVGMYEDNPNEERPIFTTTIAR